MVRTSHRRAFTLVELLVVTAVFAVLAGLLLAAIQKVRDASSRLACQNHLRQLSLALHQHHETHSKFPSGHRHHVRPPWALSFVPDPEPYPLMTWHTRLLPYLEQEGLWRDTVRAYGEDKYGLNNPPHSAGYQTLPVFICPADGPRTPPPTNPRPGPRPALTSFLGIEGIGRGDELGMLFLDSGTRFASVTDGTSHTLFVGERPPARYGERGRWAGGWGYWGNADSILGVREGFVDSRVCPPGPYLFRRGRIDDECDAYRFWSLHPGGANFLFVDGAVKFLAYSDGDALPALATRAGGETQRFP